MGETEYRALLDDLPLMIFKLDGQGTVVAVNEHGAGELGYRMDELIGQPVFEVIHPRDVHDLERQLAQALDCPGEVLRWELRKVRKDGSELWVREIVRAVETADGARELLVVCEDVSERRQVARRLAEARDQLRDLNAELSRVAEREHRRIARILHDEVGHTLAAARMAICELQVTEPADERHWCLEELQQMIDASIEVTRSLSAQLSPPILYELGLLPALQALGEKMEEKHRIAFRLEQGKGWTSPSRDVSIVLYQVVRELFHNVVKHSRADFIRLELGGTERGIHLVVEDDGVGFDLDNRAGSGGLGLFHARERLNWLGGAMEIDSGPGRGTRVLLSMPEVSSDREAAIRESSP